jgi:hypothetical protein
MSKHPDTDRILELLRRGDTAEQVASRYKRSVVSVRKLARHHGVTLHESAMLGIATPLGVRVRAHGGAGASRRGPQKEDDPTLVKSRGKGRERGVVTLSRLANAKLNEIHRHARIQAADRRRGRPLTDEEKRIRYLKKRHELVRLGRKYGVTLHS